MKRLLRTKKYNAGLRPSEHVIGERSFLKNNGGAIPPSVLTVEQIEPESLLIGSNTHTSEEYLDFCDKHGLPQHPARMPRELAAFFIKLCTDRDDVVLDPFSGSNTTGATAEELGRRWISVEADEAYALAGASRFESIMQVKGRRRLATAKAKRLVRRRKAKERKAAQLKARARSLQAKRGKHSRRKRAHAD